MGLLTATRYVTSIQHVDVEELAASGVRCVLMDRDNTCVPRDSKVAPREVSDWIDRVHAAGMSTCLVSNNIHAKQVTRSAQELRSDVVHSAMKPFPFALRRACAKMQVQPSECVMIGDQVYTDVVAGNLAGIPTILVRPQCESDLWYTKIFRIWERWVLRNHVFEGEGA